MSKGQKTKDRIANYFKRHPYHNSYDCELKVGVSRQYIDRVMNQMLRAGTVSRVPAIPAKWEFLDD